MNKNNNTYSTRKITDYFEKVTETTEKELTGQTQNTKMFPLQNKK